MRRSSESIVGIVKQATSKKKILKLSIEYGVTTKTIKKWIEKNERGEFNIKQNENNSKINKVENHKKGRQFNNFYFTVTKIQDPLKNGNGGLFRYQFKDIETGNIFCGYSREKSRDAADYFYITFRDCLQESGFKSLKISTNITIENNDQITHKRKFSEIRSKSSFVLKKNSYIKEREKYESCTDFLFDSLATVCRHNEISIPHLNFTQKAKKALKKINFKLHCTVYLRYECELQENLIREHLKNCYERAVEFHSKYDLINADYIYEKLYYILKDTEIDIDLLLLVLMQRNKIAGLKHNVSHMKKFTIECSRLLSKKCLEKRDFYLKSFYYILMDQKRLNGEKNKAIFYLKKIEEVLKRINDPHETALFNLNAGRLYINHKKFDLSLSYFNKAKVIIDENDFKDIATSMDESFADLYNKKGDYDSTKKVYKEMIDNDTYSTSPYYRGLLLAKYADQFHLTGDLEKAVKLYDDSLSILNKHTELKVFRHLSIIIESNKAFTLFKMNDFENSKAIFEKNLKLSKEHSFKEQILTNITFLIMAENEISDIEMTEKHLKELSLLLKNINKPEIQYKYYLAKGELERNKSNYSAAEVEMKKAVDMTQNKTFSILSSYFEAALKLLDLYSFTKDLTSAKLLADQIIKKAKKNKLDNYIFKTQILKEKCKYSSKNDIKSYSGYLNTFKTKTLNEELKYFIQREQGKIKSKISKIMPENGRKIKK
ncbi:MAG: hypothetical protein JXN63_08980 [Candidatus Delongbacteria bacterium]|nr:hypothetical protein [Candidatus Delongbacteria bacterium]